MDKLREVEALITTITTTARGCKDAFAGVKAYHRHPPRLVYALSELHEETTELRYHVAKLDTLVAELCAACILCAESNGTASMQKENPDGEITAGLPA